MSEQKQQPKMELVKPEMLNKFNEIQAQITSIETFEKNGAVNMMAVAAAKANVIAQLQILLNDGLVGNIKKTLENTNLGFKTDKTPGGYPLTTIRTCLVEAAIKGAYWHNNEFNIIAGNCYFTKEGLKGMMDRNSRFSDVKLSFGIPKVEKENQRAIIEVKATWKFDGKPDSIDAVIPIKWNQYTTDDAIIGKANRKIRARIIEQATGNVIPEADADEYVSEVKANSAEDAAYEVEIDDDADQDFNGQFDEEPEQTEDESEGLEVESAEDVAEDTNTLSEQGTTDPSTYGWDNIDSVVNFIKNAKDTKTVSIFKRENKDVIKSLKGENREKVLKALDEKENQLLKGS